jgi:hypothetical protein
VCDSSKGYQQAVWYCAPDVNAQVGSVIRSPEMAALVPALLSAIADPNASTRSCLDTLLATTFVNTIDAPSLALVVPVVHRGLRDRSGDTKKRAARIVGNMCSLTNDPKVVAPAAAACLRWTVISTCCDDVTCLCSKIFLLRAGLFSKAA